MKNISDFQMHILLSIIPERAVLYAFVIFDYK